MAIPGACLHHQVKAPPERPSATEPKTSRTVNKKDEASDALAVPR